MAEAAIKSLRLSDRSDDHVLVAAIDFGTTYSGYAFSMRTNQKDIIMNKNWGEAQGHSSYKTPTCVLLDGAKNFVAFGFDAESKYAEYEADCENKKDVRHLFRHFKMALYKATNAGRLSKHMKIKAVDGIECEALTIFAMALAYLKNHLLDALKLTTGQTIPVSIIKWVLTVPAIWRDDAKQFMREAAVEAGLIECMSSRQLMIALEPEAASIFCRQLDINDFKQSGGRTKLNTKAGTKYFVIDAGGGTIDITAHEILVTGDVKEVLPPSGGDWGGTCVDNNFVDLLKGVLGSSFINKFIKNYPGPWVDMMFGFQTAKNGITPDAVSVKVRIPAYNMDEVSKEVYKETIAEVINKNKETTGVKFSNGLLIVDKACIAKLFNPVISRIIQHLVKLFRNEKMASCGYVFLVGGFGNSQVLYDALRKSSAIPILVPPDPQIAIMKGAVLFGHNSGVITARIARRTYGLSANKKAEPWHNQKKVYTRDDGELRCKGLFNLLVDKGEEVKIGSTKKISHWPPSQNCEKIVDRIISSDLPSSKFTYIDDPGVEKVGSIMIELPLMDVPRKDREIVYEVTFGDTEIHVFGTDLATGNKSETFIDFLSE